MGCMLAKSGRPAVTACCWFAMLVPLAAAERFIVELEGTRSVSNMTRNLADSPPPCLLGAGLDIGTVFADSPIFTGFSVRVRGQRPGQKQCLLSMDGVARVWPSQTYKLASSTGPAAVDGTARFNSSTFHELTGVNELHARGVTGSGVVVAALDTGIDYLHQGLGGGFGEGYRVRFGYDLVGDGYLNGGAPVEGADPFTECHYHGTHVAGIIGGNDTRVGFVGVAPDVALEMYRCTGCTNQPLNSEVVIKAALMAHGRAVDVISASLILEEGAYGDDALTEVLSRIAQHGHTVVVLAAGNWGWAGTFSAAAPAAAAAAAATRGVLVVGAVNAQQVHRYAPRARYQVLGERGSSDFAWSPAPPSRFPDEPLALRALTLNVSVESDACSPSSLPSPRPRPRRLFPQGVVVLVRRGGCDFADKMATIKAAGAEYALVYDNTPEPQRDDDDDDDDDDDAGWSLVHADNTLRMRGMGFISASTGERLVGLLGSGREVLLTLDSNFTLAPFISPAAPNSFPPGQLAPRGTWGPDGEMGLVPSLLAPGIGIVSTFPRSWGGYHVLSGTSMSAPYVAGCAALVRQLHPHITAADIVRRLMTTSRPVRFHDGKHQGGEYAFLAPPYKQGAGLVDCLAAATTTTQLSASHLALGDAESFVAEHRLHLVNAGAADALYQVSHVPAASVDSLSRDGARVVPMTLAYTDNVASDEFLETLRPELHARLHIDPPQPQLIRLAPGTEAAVHLSFDISGFAPERCPLYGGFVHITQLGEAQADGLLAHLSVPYAGVACRLRHVPVLQPKGVNPVNYTFLTAATLQEPLGGPYAAEPITPYHVFTIPGPHEREHTSAPTLRFPTISLSLAMQTRAVSLDLVPLPQGSGPAATPDQQDDDDYHGWPAFSAAVTTQHPGGFSRVWTKYFAFRGRLHDGSWASPGHYVFRVCGVRAWHDPRDPAAFGDCVDTDPFVLRYIGGDSSTHADSPPPSPVDLGRLDLYSDHVVTTLIRLVFMLVLITCLFTRFGRTTRQPWQRFL